MYWVREIINMAYYSQNMGWASGMAARLFRDYQGEKIRMIKNEPYFIPNYKVLKSLDVQAEKMMKSQATLFGRGLGFNRQSELYPETTVWLFSYYDDPRESHRRQQDEKIENLFQSKRLVEFLDIIIGELQKKHDSWFFPYAGISL